MKTNVLLFIYAMVAAASSLSMLISPSFHLFIHGAPVEPQAEQLIRYIGALYAGIAVMAWTARTAAPGQTRFAILHGLALSSWLASIVTIFMALSGIYNVVIWISFVLQTAFAVGLALAANSASSAGK